jgi:hypothetical protein
MTPPDVDKATGKVSRALFCRLSDQIFVSLPMQCAPGETKVAVLMVGAATDEGVIASRLMLRCGPPLSVPVKKDAKPSENVVPVQS